jgi:type IV secretory pathway TrbF-like protein
VLPPTQDPNGPQDPQAGSGEGKKGALSTAALAGIIAGAVVLVVAAVAAGTAAWQQRRAKITSYSAGTGTTGVTEDSAIESTFDALNINAPSLFA